MNTPTFTEIDLCSVNFMTTVRDRSTHLYNMYEFTVCDIKCCLRSIHKFNWNGYIYWPTNCRDRKCSTDELNRVYTNYAPITFNDGIRFGFSTVTDTEYCLLRELTTGRSEATNIYRSFDFVKKQTEQLACQVVNRMRTSIPVNQSSVPVKQPSIPSKAPAPQVTPVKPPIKCSTHSYQEQVLNSLCDILEQMVQKQPNQTSTTQNSNVPFMNYSNLYPSTFEIPRTTQNEPEKERKIQEAIEKERFLQEERLLQERREQIRRETENLLQERREQERREQERLVQEEQERFLQKQDRREGVESDTEDSSDLTETESDDDLPDLEPIGNESKPEEQKLHNPTLASLMEQFDYPTVLAMESLMPGSILKLLNAKPGETPCICGQCPKEANANATTCGAPVCANTSEVNVV